MDMELTEMWAHSKVHIRQEGSFWKDQRNTDKTVRTMGVTGQAARMWRNRCMLRSSILLRCGTPARLQQQLIMRIRPVQSSSSVGPGWL